MKAEVKELAPNRWAVVCEEHGERHNQNILRFGQHISNTGLAISILNAPWLRNICEEHNKEFH